MIKTLYFLWFIMWNKNLDQEHRKCLFLFWPIWLKDLDRSYTCRMVDRSGQIIHLQNGWQIWTDHTLAEWLTDLDRSYTYRMVDKLNSKNFKKNLTQFKTLYFLRSKHYISYDQNTVFLTIKTLYFLWSKHCISYVQNTVFFMIKTLYFLWFIMWNKNMDQEHRKFLFLFWPIWLTDLDRSYTCRMVDRSGQILHLQNGCQIWIDHSLAEWFTDLDRSYTCRMVDRSGQIIH